MMSKFRMDTADRFPRFAAACEVMAKFTRSAEHKLIDQEHARHAGPAKRRRMLSHSLFH